ncbi:uncharacterized protein LOC128556661 [Mercenaria mercenaria]|uniref:uncharacterized protein LOC128556661 n=1 Tax=Mercenaria mercenaria TaxID=6596 RepID=UPI00234E4613|nr:uncharacterized protein LOC128556661 [Mercenaria mercenaria]
MELEGPKLATEHLKEENVFIDEIVTDRHVQIQKCIRENLLGTKHSYDVWHVAKGIKKKLTALSKQKDCEVVGKWVKSISNYVYWSAASTSDGDQETLLAKWLSLSSNIQNIHHCHCPKFPNCLHGDLESREWLKSGTKACAKVEDVITNTRLCNDIGKLSTGPQTSEMEAYHSVLNHFAPKMHSYRYHGQLCREDLERVESDAPSTLSTPAPPFLNSGKRRPCKDETSKTLSRYTKQ